MTTHPAAADAVVPPRADCDCDLSHQVSFVIHHVVRQDHRAAYEEWLHRIIAEAGKYQGHLGAHVARPASGSDLYEISVRFASREDAERWMHSDTRKTLMEEIAPHIAEPERLDIRSGVDYWFTDATGGTSPKVWKQWLTTVSVIWPLSMLLPQILKHVFRAVPFLGRFGVAQLVTAMIMVGLLTYVIMPHYTRAIRGWLRR